MATAALVFAQLAVAAFACPGDLGRAAHGAETLAMPGCDGMDSGPAPMCVSHCVDGAQSFEKPVTAGIAPAALVGTLDWPILVPSFHALAASRPTPRAEPPPGLPLPIRNCCLRI